MTNTSSVIRKEQMVNIADRNPTAQALLLYFALQTPEESKVSNIPIYKLEKELSERGVSVNEEHLFDALQELEELMLGSIVHNQDDTSFFKRGYNLSTYADRAFSRSKLAEFRVQKEEEIEGKHKVKLIDPKMHFEPLPEEKIEEKKHTGKRGRPKGYSMKLGRMFKPHELAAREAKEANKRPSPGRPPKITTNRPEQLTAKFKDMISNINVKAQQSRVNAEPVKRSRGRPANWSLKLHRPFTAKELAEREYKRTHKNKPGRPVGTTGAYGPRGLKVPSSPAVRSVMPLKEMSFSGPVLNIPLAKRRTIRIELPETLSWDELALVQMSLENFVKNC